MLLATMVGSGIMGDRLSGGNVAIALLADTLSTGAVSSGWLVPPLPKVAPPAVVPRKEGQEEVYR